MRLLTIAITSLCTIALAEDENVIRTPAITIEQAAATTPATQPAPVAPNATAEPAAAPVAPAAPANAAPTAPAAPAVAPPAVPPYYHYPVQVSGFVSLDRMVLERIRKHGETGVDVTCHVTLNGVPHIPFTYQAVLVDREGRPHTNPLSQPYLAAREVQTGEGADTDKYTVWIPLGELFSSRPPADLYVQGRVLDYSGKVLAATPLSPLPAD